MPEDDAKHESLTVISIDSLLVCKSKYTYNIFRQLCLQNSKQTNGRLS